MLNGPPSVNNHHHEQQQQQQQQPFYSPLSGTTQVNWYQKKHSPIHIYSDQVIINHPLSASSPYTIHSILPFQFTCLTAFLHNLSPSPLWSIHWSGTLQFTLHTFLHPICLYFRNLFCCSTKITSSIPSFSLNFLLGTLTYPNITHPSDHSHLCLLK